MGVEMVNKVKAGAKVLVKKKKKVKEEVKMTEVVVEAQENLLKEENQTTNVSSVKLIMLLRNAQRGEMRKIAKLNSTTLPVSLSPNHTACGVQSLKISKIVAKAKKNLEAHASLL